MKFIFSLLFILFFPVPSAQAALSFEAADPRAVIESNQFVQVGKNIILNGGPSTVRDIPGAMRYEWNFGDGTQSIGEEVVHSYSKTGEYVVTLTVTQGRAEPLTEKRTIFAYEKLMLLLTDVTEEKERIESLVQSARRSGIYINVIESYDSTTAFMSEETLAGKLIEQESTLSGVESVLMWTTKGSGINALTRMSRERPSLQEIMKDKTIVVITNKNLNTLGRIMKTNFDIIRPHEIVLTRSYELRNLLAAQTIEKFIEGLNAGISDYQIINAETSKIGIWNSISFGVNFMITKGVPSNTIVLLLMLPVIVTLITFLKQVVGITTFGLYPPSIITLSFLALGLKFGLIILIIISLTGMAIRQLMDRFNLLHIPRVAVILCISTLVILLMLGLGTFLGMTQIATIAVFPMLIMTTLSEKFVSIQSGKGFLAALIVLAETTVVAMLCYFIVEWAFIQDTMLAYPELILLLIFFNVLMGRWTGLRLLEYVRFREVMRHAEE